MPRALVPVALLLAASLAGCLDDPAPGSSGGGGELSKEAAAALLAQGLAEPSGKFGFSLRFTKAGAGLLGAEVAHDPASGSDLRIEGDPAAFGLNASFDEAAFREGVFARWTPSGYLLLARGAALVVPSPPAAEDALGVFLEEFRPAKLFAEILGGVIERTSASQGASEIVVRFERSNATVEATVAMDRERARPLRIAMEYPGEPGKEDDPLRGADLLLEMRYGDEAALAPPAGAERALALAHRQSASASGARRTLSFSGPSLVPLAEVEALLKDPTAARADPAGAPVLWTFRLDAGNATLGNASVAFHDTDRDGRVSAGDLLTVEEGSLREAPYVVLRDTTTGLLVVPIGGALAPLLVALAAALLARRKV